MQAERPVLAHVSQTRRPRTPVPLPSPVPRGRPPASLGWAPHSLPTASPCPSPLRTLQSSRPYSPQLGQAGGSQGHSSPPQRTSGPTSVWLWRLRTQRATPRRSSGAFPPVWAPEASLPNWKGRDVGTLGSFLGENGICKLQTARPCW